MFRVFFQVPPGGRQKKVDAADPEVPPVLVELLERAGFVDVQRLDDRFFPPVIVGTKK